MGSLTMRCSYLILRWIGIQKLQKLFQRRIPVSRIISPAHLNGEPAVFQRPADHISRHCLDQQFRCYGNSHVQIQKKIGNVMVVNI